MLSAITEFPVPNITSTTPLTLAPDGNLWFAQNEPNNTLEIGRITPSGVVTEFPVASTGSLSEELTLGPDGNLWFSTHDSIDRITTSGAITAFPLPSGSAVPGGLTVGSDGNLWFTLSNESPTGGFATAVDIGRITTAGAITEFSVPVPGFSIGPMTLAPDGNLWFTEGKPSGIPPFVVYTNAEIGRVTPSGVVATFPLAYGYSAPRALTLGPDGNLWFTEFDGGLNDVDRITTAGDITQFPASGGLEAGDLTVGPDGNLWFPEESSDPFPQLANSGAIGRITTAGAITQFPLLANAADTVAAGDLTVAPDGALWFIGSSFSPGQDGVIGRITTSGVLTEVQISPGPANENSVLTVGSDGNLWFPESSGMIARINIVDVPTIAAVAHSRAGITAITFDFPDALNPATARKRGVYVIDAQVKRHHQLAYGKAVRIRRISYDAAANRVTLKLARPQKGSLQVAVLGGILPDGGTSSNTVLEALVE